MDFFRQYGLLLYFLLFFFVAFVGRSYLVYRRTGVNPFVLPASDSALGYVGRVFKVVVLGSALVAALHAIPDSARWLGPINLLEGPTASSVGWALLIASLVWVVIAQVQMGMSWRIGIDTKRETELVESGLFAISRNPIFLAMRVQLVGLFLVVPSAFALALLAAGEILMQVQVRLEEAYLSDVHRDRYRIYAARVRRWL